MIRCGYVSFYRTGLHYLLAALSLLAWGCSSPTASTSNRPEPTGKQASGGPERPNSSEAIGSSATQAAPSKEEETPQPTHRKFTGPGYALRLPVDGWTVHKVPSPPDFPKEARVGISGANDCFGAVLVHSRTEGESLEKAKERSVSSLSLEEVQTLFETRLLYNSTTAYQYNLRGEKRKAEGGRENLRVQGTIARSHDSFIEVRAWSSRSFETARSCHDTVTASFTNLGMGATSSDRPGTVE